MNDCFGEPLSKEECNSCKQSVECLMTLYDEPLPSLVLYDADLLEGETLK